MASPTRVEAIASFDGGMRIESAVARPDRYRFFDQLAGEGHFISRGGGYSYAAASFGAGATSIDHRSFNRILGFDTATGHVHVEAGLTLGDLFAFLRSRGWYLPTQPGFPAITVGGCIAAECHGKNQLRDGCFSAQVASLELFHPAHGTMTLSRTQNAALFELTCGGFGLTGCILSATLIARPIEGSQVEVRTEAVDDARALPAVLRRHAESADFAYSWHDFNTSAPGPGFVMSGTRAGAPDKAASTPRASDLRWDTRSAFPVAGWNGPTASLATALYRHLSLRERSPRSVPLFDAMFPLATKGAAYFKLFGARGFCEFQAVIPESAFAPFCDAVWSRVRSKPIPITLASAKLFGGDQRFLRFAGSGVNFALDFPRTEAAPAFLEFLDGLTLEMGLVPNAIKDSRLPAAVARRAFPGYDAFAEQLRAFDPKRTFRSEMSERLGL
ncbi:FAD-binding oxidoreductase [Usitatibacter palustris]|uniref:Decaprenylphosphoryl-beta-D-ribose oxidase n=1 Tax=Usitatibacter palustris TaxID=2732487 RepID=A0A6M4HCP7_9PROT|nr:FAD-binding oxidoreductase [Usitatibacter palustris]QJR16508.1 Decaprenylphosphoryl-beta-D-ribose oxidase [Usitatibacter palustris]